MQELAQLRALDETERARFIGDEADRPERAEWTVKPWSSEKQRCCMQNCKWCAEDENRAFVSSFYIFVFICFWTGVWVNWNGGFQQHFALEVAKGFGWVLDAVMPLVLLPMLRSLQSSLRGIGGADRGWIPMDEPLELHMVFAKVVGYSGMIHTIGHAIHATYVWASPNIQEDPLGLYALERDDLLSGRDYLTTLTLGLQFTTFWSRLVGWTGVWLVVQFSAIFLTAWEPIRRGTSQIGKRFGGFNLFWKFHLTWPIAYIVTLLHSPQRFFIFMVIPTFLIALDRIYSSNRRRPYAGLVRCRLLPSNVIHLVFERPDNWHMEAGQYIRIWWEGEWHPFTLTSAPEEKVLSLHIKCEEATDWCAALRKFLTIYAPHIAMGTPGPPPKTVPEWTNVEFYRCFDPATQLVYSRPKVGDWEEAEEAQMTPTLTHQASLIAEKPSKAKLPADAVVMQIDGPFGAPAVRVWEFNIIMVVGTGIGVTPFAAILRSASLKTQHRLALLQAINTFDDEQVKQGGQSMMKSFAASFAASIRVVAPPEDVAGKSVADVPDFMKQWVDARRSVNMAAGSSRLDPASAVAASIRGTINQRSMNKSLRKKSLRSKGIDELNPAEQLEDLIDEIIYVPEKIYFYWIIRSQKEFDWFAGLLTAAVAGPTKEIIEINIFMTASVEVNKTKPIPNVNRQFVGRPVWGQLFKEVKDAHRGEHIGVFLCGAKAVGAQLHSNSLKNSDPPYMQDATKFTFFTESF